MAVGPPRHRFERTAAAAPPANGGISPSTVAPFFILVALINIFAVATRFDALAAKLPPELGPALMIGQFPLLLLAGYFEGRIDYGPQMKELPLWMRLDSKPVKVAFTFAFIYIACVALQTWDVSIGPMDPTPPAQWPLKQRAMWFTIFTAGFFFPFYLAATGALIPVLRVVTKPLRALPSAVGAILALVIGGGLGILVFAAATDSEVKAFIKMLKAMYTAHPEIGVALTALPVVGPLVLGLFVGSSRGGSRSPARAGNTS